MKMVIFIRKYLLYTESVYKRLSVANLILLNKTVSRNVYTRKNLSQLAIKNFPSFNFLFASSNQDVQSVRWW